MLITLFPPIEFTEDEVTSLKKQIPELPIQKTERFITNYELNSSSAEIITRDKATAEYFESACKTGKTQEVEPKDIANEIINKKVNIGTITAEELVAQIKDSKNIEQIDSTELQKIITEVISENPQPVTDYKSGKENVLMFLMGQTMKKLGRKADMNQIKNAILEALK